MDAETTDTETTDAEGLVNELRTTIHAGAYERLDEHVSESFVLRSPDIPEEDIPGPAGEAHGPEGLAAYERHIDERLPDLEESIIHVLSGDGVVMCEGEMTFTWTSEGDDGQPTDTEVEIPFTEVFEITDGSIDEVRVYFDRHDALDQMGLL